MATVTFEREDLVTVRWTTEGGEDVEGVFRLVGWVKAPTASVQDVIDRQKHAPVTVVHPHRDHAKG